jgi:hypothetical protein
MVIDGYVVDHYDAIDVSSILESLVGLAVQY